MASLERGPAVAQYMRCSSGIVHRDSFNAEAPQKKLRRLHEHLLDGKENAAPSHRDLTASGLHTRTHEMQPPLSRDLASQRRRYEASITRLQRGDEIAADPVKVWRSYVEWATKHCPAAGDEVHALLARACRELSKDERHYDDIGYLRLWVLYVDCQKTNAQETFRSLYEKGIGTEHALLYEAWARTFEQRNQLVEAAHVYKLGINRGIAYQGRLRLALSNLEGKIEERKARAERRRQLEGKWQGTRQQAAGETERNDAALASAARLGVPLACMAPAAAQSAGVQDDEAGLVARKQVESASITYGSCLDSTKRQRLEATVLQTRELALSAESADDRDSEEVSTAAPGSVSEERSLEALSSFGSCEAKPEEQQEADSMFWSRAHEEFATNSFGQLAADDAAASSFVLGMQTLGEQMLEQRNEQRPMVAEAPGAAAEESMKPAAATVSEAKVGCRGWGLLRLFTSWRK
eukprot:TRINITY_DN21336_c0_g1_i1.p1 TRINITY_DN21336_c0_g1~~TRINITY_DN21336_c0_g1_i1.p1  ORF type:complete len:466 (+),score=93.93 TRINITY_DN21336_c0_g1_i1:85-1482(+)